MQLMPGTAATLGLGDPFDPRENIEAGVRHLRALMDQFDNNLPLALAAYNAGGQAVIVHRGIPPYRQTRDRKSTRLNSSHRTISYAVFCLKKKKKNKKTTSKTTTKPTIHSAPTTLT